MQNTLITIPISISHFSSYKMEQKLNKTKQKTILDIKTTNFIYYLIGLSKKQTIFRASKFINKHFQND